jgi:hypothetical protein
VAGPLTTTVTLLESGDTRVCLITPHMNSPKGANISPLIRRTAAEALNLPLSHVLLMVSHNHTDFNLVSNHIEASVTLAMDPSEIPAPQLVPAGQEFLNQLGMIAKQLPDLLQPVTVWWAVGNENRLTYNRKGRRADGSTYLMREEDRDLMGVDFKGDVDEQAPIVVFKNEKVRPSPRSPISPVTPAPAIIRSAPSCLAIGPRSPASTSARICRRRPRSASVSCKAARGM